MGRPAKPWFRSSRGAWYVTHNGTQVNLGVTDPNAEAAAVEAFRRLLAVSGPPPASPTVAVAVERYFADRPYLKPATVRGYRRVTKLFAERFGTQECKSVEAAAVEAWAKGRWQNPSTRWLSLTVCAAVLKSGGWAGRIRRPRMRSLGAESVIAPDVWEKVAAAAEGEMGAFLRFLWGCGCRPSEAASLTAADVDFGSGVATLEDHKTAGKTGKKLLYLTPACLAILSVQAERHPTGKLFRNKWGRELRQRTWVHQVTRAARKVGVKITAKFARHSYITHALERGESSFVVAKLVGHTTTRMVEGAYSHASAMTRSLVDAAARVRPGPPPAA